MVTGTPAYLAPEVARGEPRPRPPTCSRWASTLYTALEGRPPFGARDNPMALLHRVASARVDPPLRAGALTALLTAHAGGPPRGPAEHAGGEPESARRLRRDGRAARRVRSAAPGPRSRETRWPRSATRSRIASLVTTPSPPGWEEGRARRPRPVAVASRWLSVSPLAPGDAPRASPQRSASVRPVLRPRDGHDGVAECRPVLEDTGTVEQRPRPTPTPTRTSTPTSEPTQESNPLPSPGHPRPSSCEGRCGTTTPCFRATWTPDGRASPSATSARRRATAPTTTPSGDRWTRWACRTSRPHPRVGHGHGHVRLHRRQAFSWSARPTGWSVRRCSSRSTGRRC